MHGSFGAKEAKVAAGAAPPRRSGAAFASRSVSGVEKTVKRLLATLVLLGILGTASAAARAAQYTFLLGSEKVFESIERFDAFLAAHSSTLRGVVAIPAGVKYAGRYCVKPSGGENLSLAEIVVLDSAASVAREFGSRGRRNADRIAQAMGLAAVDAWAPPALLADSSTSEWVADATWADPPYLPHFQAQGLLEGSSVGFLTEGDAGTVFRFTINVDPGLADPATGFFRFLLKLRAKGETASKRGKPKTKERTCFTFVDLRPVDPPALGALVDSLGISDPPASLLHRKIERILTQLARGNVDTALEILGEFVGVVGANAGGRIDPVRGRVLLEAVLDTQRGLTFVPSFPTCGNSKREIGEACDGADLAGQTCESLGFHSGVLSCGPDCVFSTAGCVPLPVCGNGVVEVGEECDNGPNNSDREPDACRRDCREAFCGDGVVDLLEDCDGRNLDGSSCREEGWEGGTLRCDDECFFDEDGCFDRDF